MHYLLPHGQTLWHHDHRVEVCFLSENRVYPLPKIDKLLRSSLYEY